MDRTLISWNVPNLITIPLMAGLGFLFAGVIWQIVKGTLPQLGAVQLGGG